MSNVTITHPDIAGSAVVTAEAFTLVWEDGGWEIASVDPPSPLPAPMRWANDWDANRHYEAGDLVDVTGVTFLCSLANRNKPPAINPSFWEPVGSTAAIGRIGTTLGASSLNEADELVLSVDTDWGINDLGEPYWAPGEVVPGEEAILLPDLGGGINFLLLADLAIRSGVAPLLDTNNLSDLSDPAAARASLGLGSAALRADSYFALPADIVAALTGIYAPLWSRVAAPLPFTNDTTLVDAVSVTPTINQTYRVRAHIIYEASTVGDLKVKVVAPAGATFSLGVEYLTNGATGVTSTQSRSHLTGSGGTFAIGGIGAGTRTWIEFEGELVMGATAGAFAIQAAQQVADPTPSIVVSGHMKLERIT